jgi:hypothetical protein
MQFFLASCYFTSLVFIYSSLHPVVTHTQSIVRSFLGVTNSKQNTLDKFIIN